MSFWALKPVILTKMNNLRLLILVLLDSKKEPEC